MKDDIEKRLKALPSVSFENHAEIKSYSKDTISRRAAVSGISDLLMLELKGERLPTYNEVYRAIYGLPPAQQWTYVEVELPETIINEHTHDYQEYNCLCDFGDYGFDVRTYKFGNGHFWNGGGTVDKYVTAWQPLPEIPDALKQKPWEGGQDGV